MEKNVVEVDKLTFHVLVDNETDSLSSGPVDVVTSEISYRFQTGLMKELNCGEMCCAGHGYSVMAIAEKDGVQHCLLFDGGPCGSLWESNAKKMAVNLPSIERVVLSHWHSDHSGGLTHAVEMIHEARQSQNLSPVIVDVHPNRPYQRGFIYTAQGDIAPISLDPTLEALEKAGGVIERIGEGHAVLDGFFYISGEIPRTTSYEEGIPGHKCRDSESGPWRDDPLILDERFLAVRVKDKGLVIFSSCSHAGIVNVCREASRIFENDHVHLVAGGFHLAGRSVEARIENTVRDLMALSPTYVCPGHCTGWRAKVALANACAQRHNNNGGQHNGTPDGGVQHNGYVPCVVGATFHLHPEWELVI
eukprot:TRINITY_DN19101_c0_g1::TRINITY_DN19101_c0_g1_i1::g.13937::m.13937 TRINITY_DN19101_c0_g1::TRINITY_DN19101_c0_g1_i1::g.13937  ORF type:complete len:380 (+),score=38.50,sp/Q57749/DHPSL_METJA/32.95/7e-23,Lactamase_B/PF00753.22/5.1e-05,Lactamase_B/PF00753.22/2.3e+03,Lactamase_B_2/PF12706.2/0.00072 TRINITY_DN19101_c0_g1_i1:55-1140(+)